MGTHPPIGAVKGMGEVSMYWMAVTASDWVLAARGGPVTMAGLMVIRDQRDCWEQIAHASHSDRVLALQPPASQQGCVPRCGGQCGCSKPRQSLVDVPQTTTG